MTGYDTGWPADSVEFCPHPSYQDIFVCGTYKLEQNESAPLTGENGADIPGSGESAKQKRKGECLLFRVGAEDDLQLSLLQKTSLPAILDMKWCHAAPSVDATLAVADSEGGITLHVLRGEQTVRLDQLSTVACASEDVLCLSLDWSTRLYPSSSLGSLAVSLSDGSLSLLRPDETVGLKMTHSWHAHDYEPWITAWNYWDTNVIYSGGDDLKMKAWDVRQDCSQPLFVNERFDAGVTTIQSHPHFEHLLAVGSYDNSVRLFDTRRPLVPLAQADVGGGAWRVKWHPSPERKRDLLVACMHDGFKVVRFDLDSSGTVDATSASRKQWDTIKRFDKHESLAYGVDWSFPVNGEDTLIASCSFYDHALRIWKG